MSFHFLVFFSLICLVLVSAKTPWPKIITGYNCLVVGNVVNFDGSAFTLTYEESFDADRNILRTEGRFGSARTVELFYFDQDVVFTYDKNQYVIDAGNEVPGAQIGNDPYACNVTSWTKYPDHQWSGSSIGMLNDIGKSNTSAIVYMGTTFVRGILCDFWEVYTNYSFNNRMIQVTNHVHFAVDSAPVERVPVRLEAFGTVTWGSQTVTFSRTYDWVDVLVTSPPFSLFVPPGKCSPYIPVSHRGFFRNSSAFNPVPNTELPSLPPIFNTYVEYKCGDLDSVVTYQWTANLVSSRIDRYSHIWNSISSPIKLTTYLYDFSGDSKKGKLYVSELLPTSSTYETCKVKSVSVEDRDYKLSLDFSADRADILGLLFSNPSFYQSNQIYLGQHSWRSVIVDAWSAMRVIKLNGFTFNFNCTILFYPRGWNFPGRSVSSNAQIPIRVSNFGDVIDLNGVKRVYNETWDFYSMIPISDSDALIALDPSKLCSNYVEISDKSGSKVSLIVGAVLGSLLGIVAIIISYCVYKRAQSTTTNYEEASADQDGNIAQPVRLQAIQTIGLSESTTPLEYATDGNEGFTH